MTPRITRTIIIFGLLVVAMLMIFRPLVDALILPAIVAGVYYLAGRNPPGAGGE